VPKSNGERLNIGVSAMVLSADCAGELLFVGGDTAFQEKYAGRYLPNFYPRNAKGEVERLWRSTYITKKEKEGIFVTETGWGDKSAGARATFFTVGVPMSSAGHVECTALAIYRRGAVLALYLATHTAHAPHRRPHRAPPPPPPPPPRRRLHRRSLTNADRRLTRSIRFF
jgi:hypothetical protein